MADVQEATAARSKAAAESFMSGVSLGLDKMVQDNDMKAIAGIESISKHMDEMSKTRDSARKAAVARIASAELETLVAAAGQEDKDLAKAMMGLEATLAALGKQFADLEQLSPEEQAIVDQAKADVTLAESEVARAKEAWFFRTRRINAANLLVTHARTTLTSAEARAAQMQRDRLMGADMENSLQRFQALVSRTQQILVTRAQAVQGQLNAVGAFRKQLITERDTVAGALNDLTGRLEALTRDLATEEGVLNGLVKDTPDYIAQNTKVDGMKTLFTQLTMAHNEAEASLETKEQNLVSFETHQTAHTRLLGNLRIWIRKLKDDSEARVKLFRSRLEARKANADQMAAKHLDTMGWKLDRDSDADVAAISVASSRATLALLQDMPQRYRDVDAIRKQQYAEIEKNVIGMEEVRKEFRAQFDKELKVVGDADPLLTDFLTPAGTVTGEEIKKAA